MITATHLKAHTVKHLAELARKKGVLGWHSMRKDQLVRAVDGGEKLCQRCRPRQVRPGQETQWGTSGEPKRDQRADQRQGDRPGQ